MKELLNEKQINVVSQVMGITQEDIKKKIKNDHHKEMFKFEDTVANILKKYANKDEWFNYKARLENMLCIVLTYIPYESRESIIDNVLDITDQADIKIKELKKLMENEKEVGL